MNQQSQPDMSLATFRVVYDGPALAEHTMDVRDLAPAESIERAIKVPLEREGIDSVAFVYEEHVAVVVEKRDRHALTPPPDQRTQINEMEFTAPLQLVSVPLRDGYKWRVDDGNGPFTATVLDERFVQRIQKSEVAFAAGDILYARLRRRQFLDGAELRNENEIVEVVRHESAYKQIPLPITRSDA